MAIRLSWGFEPGAQVVQTNIYRCIAGFFTPTEAPFGLVNGDQLKLKINNDTLQVITFTEDMAIDDLVDFINDNITGAKAFKSIDSDALYVRNDLREDPGFIEIVGGAAAAKFGQTPKIITVTSDQHLIGAAAEDIFEFEDPNGTYQDYYALSVINPGECESDIGTKKKAIDFSGPVCVVEGCVLNLQGLRVCDIKIRAKIICPPAIEPSGGCFITKDWICTLTDKNGRFSLPLLQGTEVLLEINGVQFSEPLCIPEADVCPVSDLPYFGEYQLIDCP